MSRSANETDRRNLSRRSFLARTSGTAAVAIAAPFVSAGRVLGANDRIALGHIGLGGRGSSLLRGFKGMSECVPLAVCDVDGERRAKAQKSASTDDRKADAYNDYRRIIERKDIDAVVIGTPDHWHALPSIHACEVGKDVYVEKPMTLTVAEGRAMVNAARRYKRIVQNGSQQRSANNFRRACELVRSGYIGDLERVEVGIPGVNFKGPAVADSEPPAHLDYDFWLGPAPARPYNVKEVHYNFRFFWAYSGGQITNWGAHHLDIAQWGLGADNSGPVEIEGQAKFHPEGWYEVPMHFAVDYTYAGGVKLRCAMGIRSGTTFIGKKGKIHVNRGHLSSDPGEIAKSPVKPGDVKLYDSRNHQKNWLECLRSRELPICDVEIGHRSSSVCHLGNIAIRCGRKLRWNPETERFVDDQEADRMLHRPYRGEWKLPKELLVAG